MSEVEMDGRTLRFDSAQRAFYYVGLRRFRINLIFLNQNYLVQNEVITALRRINGIRAVALDICLHPSREQAQSAVSILESQKCGLLFTINEWGLDSTGILFEYLRKKQIPHVNWCVDDPFYDELMGRKKFYSDPLRFDFVSDRGYLSRMKELGYNAHFLPLGTDPSVFFPEKQPRETDVAFVGNSYLPQIDEFSKDRRKFFDMCFPFLADFIRNYLQNSEFQLEQSIESKLSKMRLPSDLSFEMAIFIAKHMAGFLHRKHIVVSVAQKFPGFTVYGDKGWKELLGEDRLKKVKYGEDLRKVYNGTKVNLDINRVVIRDGFTQRVFDCLACQRFLITSSKPVVHEFFVTEGPQKELVTFKSNDELISLIKYYLAHENERMEIAERGFRKVISKHSYNHRIQEIFRVLSQELS